MDRRIQDETSGDMVNDDRTAQTTTTIKTQYNLINLFENKHHQNKPTIVKTTSTQNDPATMHHYGKNRKQQPNNRKKSMTQKLLRR
ncbi:hypothetical protein [Candidatus Bathycorpusculum sp.]|jgi:hypothetical protein|uniref:hypothetical protein n=1 Tax=Candidatus Bathycorpusculum sp. TaxID=2994959 RepID=UPI0028224E97|nr:hypothetical protein [Candidatus Termitimicrobium sp.]MCL2431177.1 hypothetical protein [Candidatus Termitimicrobium sp.]